MAEQDVNSYATTGTNTAAGAPNVVETQQPGGSGALRQTMVLGDPTTRANMQTVKAASTAAVATDMGAVVHLHPSSPVTQQDTQVTGTITTNDVNAPAPTGNGVFINTAPSTNSFVAATIPGGTSALNIQISGTATGTYYFEYSMDSTTGADGNWIPGNFRQTGIVNTILGYSYTVAGAYRGDCSGFKMVRVRNIGGTSPNNAIIIRETNGGGTVFLNASIPAGTNNIGGTFLTDSAGTNRAAVTAAGALNIVGSQTTITSASWTSATAANTANTISLAGMNTVTVALVTTSTMTGGVITFEMSPDNTNWFPVAMARVNSYNVDTTFTLNVVTNQAWSTSADGFTNFRVRLSSVITGTGTALVIIKPETFAIEPIVSVGQAVASNLNGVMTLTPNGTTGGWTPYFANALVAPAGGTTISGAAGRFGGYMLQNLNSAPAYLQIFDTTAAVTLGTTTPTFVIPIPANATAANGLAANVEFTVGINLTNGLKVAATTTSTGATAVTTGLTGVILYK